MGTRKEAPGCAEKQELDKRRQNGKQAIVIVVREERYQRMKKTSEGSRELSRAAAGDWSEADCFYRGRASLA